MKTEALVLVSGVLFLAAAAISVAEGCPETSSCSMTHGTVTVEDNGDFSYALYPTWAMKTNPSWVTLQFRVNGSVNVTGVTYTPSYWQYQNCEGSQTSTCHGSLVEIEYDGNVQNRLDVGLYPDTCGTILATSIPKP